MGDKLEIDDLSPEQKADLVKHLTSELARVRIAEMRLIIILIAIAAIAMVLR